MRRPAFLEDRRIAVGIWFIPWALCAWWVAIAALPHNPQSVGIQAENRTRALLPEGWGFFTRNPREVDLIIARHDEDGRWSLARPHASAEHMFGLDRVSRALPVEASRLVPEPYGQTTACEGPWRTCLDVAEPLRLRNERSNPALCGDVGLVMRAPPPWAWAHLVDAERMPTRVLRLEITCHDQA